MLNIGVYSTKLWFRLLCYQAECMANQKKALILMPPFCFKRMRNIWGEPYQAIMA